MRAVLLEWGHAGAAALAERCDVLVVVDVLSFSTCVSVACGGGGTVWPHRWDAESAAVRAAELGALLAGPRGEAGPSLSPASLAGLPPGSRLVLPSPNGSSISFAAARSRRTVVAACLRNAAAVAARWAGSDAAIGLVPAGERWPDGSLRPAYEDLVGAGAVAVALGRPLDPDAEVAVAAYQRWSVDRLLACRSGMELVEKGCRDDVLFAADDGADDVVPELVDGAFTARG